MKITKVILFVCSFFLIGAFSVSAATFSDIATVDINVPVIIPCLNGATNPPQCTSFLTIIPDLKVTVHSDYLWVTDSDGPVVVSYDPLYTPAGGYPYTLSWGPVANATSCILDGSYVIADPSIAGSVTWETHTYINSTHDFILSCVGAQNISGSDTVTMSYPPAPTNLSYTCNLDNTLATVNWTNPAGYNTFYTRGMLVSDGHTVLYDDNVVGSTDNFTVVPNDLYKFWVHAKDAVTQAFGPARFLDVKCVPPPVVVPVGTWDAGVLHGSCSVSACGQTGTWPKTYTCSVPLGCDGLTTKEVPDSCSTAPCTYSINIIKPSTNDAITVNSGKSLTIGWESNNMGSCSGISKDPGNLVWTGISGEITTSKLEKTTTYRIDCLGTNGVSYSDSIKVLVDKTTLQEI